MLYQQTISHTVPHHTPCHTVLYHVPAIPILYQHHPRGATIRGLKEYRYRHTALPTNTTNAQEHAFRATEEERARDEREQSTNSLTAEPYEGTRRACPALSTRARTSMDTILLLYQYHAHEYRYHAAVVPTPHEQV